MPVGTRGAVRTLSAVDLDDLGAEVVLGNTYHLMLRPGADVVARLGGLHGFTDWGGHVLTDSGGYQVFSLKPKVDDEGATFRSTYDGSSHHLSPEAAVDVQVALGADIQMVLDVCPPLPSPDQVIRAAVDRTALWAGRARKAFLAHERPDLNQFGIVQGGVDLALRAESAERTVASGSTATGSVACRSASTARRCSPRWRPPPAGCRSTSPATSWASGDPVGIVEAIARGVDMFDCVLPTRLGRHGTLLTARAGSTCATAVRRRPRPDPPGLRLPGLRPLVPRLPAPPPVGGRADGAPAADPAQRGLDVRPRRPHPRRDRRRDARRAAGRGGRRVARRSRRPTGSPMTDRRVTALVLPAAYGAADRPRPHLRPVLGAVHPPAAAPGPGAPGAGGVGRAGGHGRARRASTGASSTSAPRT